MSALTFTASIAAWLLIVVVLRQHARRQRQFRDHLRTTGEYIALAKHEHQIAQYILLMWAGSDRTTAEVSLAAALDELTTAVAAVEATDIRNLPEAKPRRRPNERPR